MKFLNDIQLTENDLKDIENEGKRLTPPEQIAVQKDIPEEIFLTMIATPGNPARKAYLRGMAVTEGKLRETAIDAAMAGSPAAMEQTMTFLKIAIHKL